MHLKHHIEQHFTASETVRDIVIGMSDGLTVPFALAAGLSGTTASAALIVTAGLAEIAAGSIAMGLGGYLAAKSDCEHYEHELKRETEEVERVPEIERAEVAEVFLAYGLTQDQVEPILDAFQAKPEAWIDFMMKFELGLEKPNPKRALLSAATIAGSYIAGGLIPLFPYMITKASLTALTMSVVVTLTALAVFGFIKGRFTGISPLKGALQTTLVGGIAAAAAFGLARAFSEAKAPAAPPAAPLSLRESPSGERSGLMIAPPARSRFHDVAGLASWGSTWELSDARYKPNDV